MSIKRIQGAIIVGNLVFTSGVTGGKCDVETQIRTSLDKLKTILNEAGTSFENVVKATVFLSDLDYRPKYLNPIWAETFTDNRPSRTCVEVGVGPDIAIDIELVATISLK